MQEKTGNHLYLIHGWGFDSGVMRDLVPALEQHYRVSLLDLPGYGKRPPAVCGQDLEAIAETLITQISPGSILVGWSLGGMIAIRIAARMKRSIKALVLIAGTPCFARKTDWPHGVEAESIKRMAGRLAAGGRDRVLREFTMLVANGDTEAKKVMRNLQALTVDVSASNETLMAGLDILANADLRDEFARLSCPVFMLLGANDRLVAPAAGTAAKEIQPALRLKVLEAAGHAPFISRPRQFCDALNTCLQEVA